MRSNLIYVYGLSSLLAAAVVRAEPADSSEESFLAEAQHEVVQANTLWDLANYYYKDPWQWPRIYEANKDKIKDPHWIYPGQVFIIPGLGKIVTIGEISPKPAQPALPKAADRLPPQSTARSSPAMDSGNGETLPDGLSVDFPEGMAGQQPAVYRMRLPKDWKPDGRVIRFKDREALAAAGDFVHVTMDNPQAAGEGQRYTVYRRTGPTEQDKDREAVYVQKMGVIELAQKISINEYRAMILQSGGSLDEGDVLKASSR